MRSTATHRTTLACMAAALCALSGGVAALAQDTAQPLIVDRVVAVVNTSVILASDIDNELQLAVLEPETEGKTPTARQALDELISRTLIQQQIRQEDADAAQPSAEAVQSRLADLRKELPACVRANCATDTGWASFLAAHGLSQDKVDHYLRGRIEILTFIENRFRQGIRIEPTDIEAYYRDTLLPQYPKEEAAPSLESVSSRISEILLQGKVNALFDTWLDNLRKQGNVEVLDPALKTAANGDGQ